ncbi:hypothetical protein HFD88_003975 [Aspergillus terreus]|nr:hypothetical protein HFD88_003975 [Aspergillus terreus]
MLCSGLGPKAQQHPGDQELPAGPLVPVDLQPQADPEGRPAQESPAVQGFRAGPLVPENLQPQADPGDRPAQESPAVQGFRAGPLVPENLQPQADPGGRPAQESPAVQAAPAVLALLRDPVALLGPAALMSNLHTHDCGCCCCRRRRRYQVFSAHRFRRQVGGCHMMPPGHNCKDSFQAPELALAQG